MANLTAEEATDALIRLGWRIRSTGELTQAATNFQRAWNLGPAIDPIGVVGPRTSEALRISLDRRARRLPTASEHFSFSEFHCKCGGGFGDCQRIWILRAQLERLEAYRVRVGGPVRIISGCRCPGHNRKVGGARASQHLFGSACDVQKVLTTGAVTALRQFAGIGQASATGLVAHVDSRDVSGHNTTGGTPAAPTVWKYF